MKNAHPKLTVGSLGLALVVSATALVATPTAADDGPPAHEVLPVDEIEWEQAPPSLPPGAEVTVIEGDLASDGLTLWRLKFPADYRIAPHWHGVTERVTVLSGALHVGSGETFDEAALTRLTPGGHFSMPPKHAHYVWAEEETEIQLTTIGAWSITYIDPADDPRR